LLQVDLVEISIVTFPLLAGSQVTAIGGPGDLANAITRAGAIMRAAE